MATVKVPGTNSVTTTVGEMLVIEFVEDCCFCCNPEQVDFFYPQLPLGDHEAGMVWTGVARESGTISFGHKPYGGECMARNMPAPEDPGRTITVGGGG
jgi:hypothetical protein